MTSVSLLFLSYISCVRTHLHKQMRTHTYTRTRAFTHARRPSCPCPSCRPLSCNACTRAQLRASACPCCPPAPAPQLVCARARGVPSSRHLQGLLPRVQHWRGGRGGREARPAPAPWRRKEACKAAAQAGCAGSCGSAYGCNPEHRKVGLFVCACAVCGSQGFAAHAHVLMEVRHTHCICAMAASRQLVRLSRVSCARIAPCSAPPPPAARAAAGHQQ